MFSAVSLIRAIGIAPESKQDSQAFFVVAAQEGADRAAGRVRSAGLAEYLRLERKKVPDRVSRGL